jgi:hypothetical protein
MKCSTCPAPGDCISPGGRLCDLGNPAHPDYSVHYRVMLAGESVSPLTIEATPARDPVCTPCGSNRALPSLLQRVANFATAAAEHVAAGRPVVTPEVFQARVATCEKCPLFSDDRKCTHPLCGCPMDRKGWWAEQACPCGLWPSVAVPEVPVSPSV